MLIMTKAKKNVDYSGKGKKFSFEGCFFKNYSLKSSMNKNICKKLLRKVIIYFSCYCARIKI